MKAVVITAQTKNELLLLVTGATILALAFFVPAVAAIVLAALWIALIVALSYNISLGWLVLVFLSPLINWELRLGFLQRYFFPFPWLYRMHAPAVEFWAVTLLLAFGVYCVRRIRSGEALVVHWPGVGWFLLFIFSALVSLQNVPPNDRLGSLKYIVHFLIFFYVSYIVLATNIVDSKKLWRQSLAVLASVGFLAALMGAASLVLGVWNQDGFYRAVPFAIFGWKPFGDQHIFLAEVITTTLPIFVFFWHQTVAVRTKKTLAVVTWFVFIIGMLTLSRAGWITMFVEALVFLWLTRHEGYWKEIKRRAHYAFAIAPLFAYLMYFLITSSVVSGSTSTRSNLLDMALFLFRQDPLIGQGVGTFTGRVTEFRAYQYEFGEVLDAQGIVQKLLAEQGMLGLVTFSLFTGWILMVILRRYHSKDYSPEARGAYFVAIFLVLSPLIFQLFNTQYYTSKMWMPIALAIAQSVLYKNRYHLLSRAHKPITIETEM
ncbi:MAG TPA: O-antigen ligase family protein [Patescibacteria group bacterium]|nr:O-antigen ligase family protein [Patescibacteria group bacterium]